MVNGGHVVAVIPARYASSRFPGKPLAQIAGKSMIERVVERVSAARGINEVIVATDHAEIASRARSAGAKVVLTPSELPTGSDRVYYAVKNLNCAYVINVQGDEPLLNPRWLDTLVECLQQHPEVEMATLARAATVKDLESQNTAKIVVNHSGQALYFSRFPIPYSRQTLAAQQNVDGCLKHIGIYGYKREFLTRFCEQQPVAIETGESLEQLRALYLGARIQVACVEGDSWGVDIPEDIAIVERLLQQD